MTLRLAPAPSEAPEPSDDVQPRTTDAGNARAFLTALPDAYRYVIQWESWLRWTGTHWEREGAGIALFAAMLAVIQAEYEVQRDVVRSLRREHVEIAKAKGLGAAETLEAAERLAAAAALLKFLHGSQNTGKIKAAIEQLKAPLAKPHTDLDRDPWLLNCANGTLDLRNADLRPHEPADFLTRCLALPYDPQAKCPEWEAFLRRCMADSYLLVLYIQRLMGYSLTASTREHLLVFCYGSGANGKSTFLQVLKELLGPYACSAPRTLLFTNKPGDVHPTELATLYGRRLAVCSEVGEDSALDEAKTKDLTGGDEISCRRMHEDFWSFAPTHKLWLAGNHKPTIRGTDHGIWRRLRVIPWTVQFAEADQDKGLGAKLQAELVGILAWAVAGGLEWLRIGVQDPPDVVTATSDYRTHSDVLGEFFKTHLVFDPEARMATRALRKLYEGWCEEVGHLPVGARRLAQRLRENAVRDIPIRVDGRVVNGWAGVRQLADFERTLPDPP